MKKLLIGSLMVFGTIFSVVASEEHHKEPSEGHDSHHGHHDGGGKAIGMGKAIEEVSETRGFKLSSKAYETLGIQLLKIKETSFSVPKKALVTFKNDTGVYHYDEGFFRLVLVKVLEREKNALKIYSKDLVKDDQVVISNANLLRVTDIYSTDKSEYGHGH